MNFPALPIDSLLPRVCASLARHPRLVLEAPPGAGKTTRVPPALLDAPWLAGRKLVMLEPRRIAARAAAAFMAKQRGEAVGQTVGYRVRFEARVSHATRIEVVTEGILTRMLQDDPELSGTGAIVFDEFHERHLAGDLGAALALDVQASLRPDLRIVVMSATLDDARIAEWLDAPVLRSEGRAFPVRIEYPAAHRGETGSALLRRTIIRALDETDGDVLVFLPGRREIAQAQAMLAGTSLRAGDRDTEPSLHPHPLFRRQRGEQLEIVPLHGDLPLDQQRAALDAADPGTRRVILATNVAESSVTVPGVRAVVDTGLAREPRFDPDSGFARLVTVTVSQASADQRAGRAGRLAPGIAWRLWPQSKRLEPARTPEIRQADLAGLALELAAWGVGEQPATTLSWLDPPPAGALAQARDLLGRLGALDPDRRITPAGRAMLALGATPRLAAAALRATPALRALATDLLALLESRSPLRGGFNDDLRVRVGVLHRYRDGGPRAAHEADTAALAAIEQAARGWRRRVGAAHAATGVPGGLAVGNLLLHAFPDRAAKQDSGDPRRYLLANGRGVRLHDASALYGEPWLVVAEARFDDRDSLVLTAAPFDPQRLTSEYPERVRSGRVVFVNAHDAVEAFEERRFDAIVLERRSVPPDADDALPALLATIRAHGLASLPWSDRARGLRARIAWLQRVLPDADLPDVSDAGLLASLETWLTPALAGRRKLGAVTAQALSGAFAARLTWPQRKLLDQAAPDAITVPSGMTRRLDYSSAAANDTAPSPILAVKLQELFGLAETPCVANGRVPVTLHLLSPAGRPIQVTRDLRSFWQHTYPEVRKELRGRYPKHPWPEDPWSAQPTHRTRRRPRQK